MANITISYRAYGYDTGHKILKGEGTYEPSTASY